MKHLYHGRLTIEIRVLFLFIITIALRLVIGTTLWLSDDEAWYWALSEKLQGGYVVHPPFSAWMIRFFTEIFGDTVFGVRISAIICASIGSWWLLQLSEKLGWKKGTWLTALFCITTPLLFFGGILNGPDLPLFLFWIGMMKVSYELATEEKHTPVRWLLFGLFSGLALLSKYTAILGVSAGGIWLLTTPKGRKAFLTPWPWLGIVVMVLCFAPVIYWNATNNWASFQFQFVSRHSNHEIRFTRWLVFLVSQFFLFGPAVLAGWLFVVRDGLRGSQKERFLALWAAFPGLFFIQPLFSPFKIHWALFAYLPVLLYVAKLGSQGQSWKKLPRLIRYGSAFGAFTATLGLSCFYVPLVPYLSKTFTGKVPEAKHDITNDFYGWSKFKEIFEKLPQSLKNLPLISNRYQLTSHAAFALGHIKNQYIMPHDSFEHYDWSGPEAMPERFLYLMDSRYHDDPLNVYVGIHCSDIAQWSFERKSFLGNFLAKTIELKLCEKNITLRTK